MSNQQAAAKIRVLAAAVAAPGTCIVCGSAGGDDREFLDIDMDIEYYGAVYFCTHCLGETVGAMGYVSRETVAATEAELEALKIERAQAFNKEQLVNEFLDTLFSSGSVYLSSRNLLSQHRSANEDLESFLDGTDGTATPSSAADKLASGTGRSLVPGATSGDTNLTL